MLKSILIVTITVAQLHGVEEAYENYLDYEAVATGAVSEQAADVWGAPKASGRPYLLLQSASDAAVFLRFIESEQTDDYAPMTSFGWNATELLVKDPDAMAQRLADSPYEIIGPPYDLWAAPNAPRAMQAIGPGNELLYLTRNNDFSIKTDVDRVFIMVVGGPSMTAFRDFYGDRLGLDISDPTPFKITVISKAQGLPPETTYPLSVARLASDFLIELDEYPSVAKPRSSPAGSLLPGIAMVGFIVEDLSALDLDFRGSPQVLSGAPYAGRRAAVAVGPAGEWLEFIEAELPD